MNIDDLKTELDTDPATIGYAAMTDEEVAAALNTINRSRNKESVSGSDIFRNINATEFNSLAAADRAEVLALCAIGSVDPFGPAAAIIVSIFGGGSTTVSTLAAFRVETISRATELGLGTVAVGHVQEARR